MKDLHVFGVRHHGPGSARSVVAALEELSPDILLLEGPPEASEILAFAADEAMRPPVALLVYVPEEPRHCIYAPFAVFSPEWQSLQYGLRHGIPVRFTDLPVANLLATGDSVAQRPKPASGTQRIDALQILAEASGYRDGEGFWDHLEQHRPVLGDVFKAIRELVIAVRETEAGPLDAIEAQREACMRQAIETARHEGFCRIAVICGAWHVPALLAEVDPAVDDALLQSLPSVSVAATWIPWTYARLSVYSGYGSGVQSPGWYHHLWEYPKDSLVHWMSRVSSLLRQEDLDVSPAHVMEAVRLAESLSALRDFSAPGLPEIMDACRAVFFQESDLPMRLIVRQLIVGEHLGAVPAGVPQVALQQDLMQEQKRLQMIPEPGPRVVDLDLRKTQDLERSHLLHRLTILQIDWGKLTTASGRKGTFHEIWQVEWKPELAMAVVAAAPLGNTVVTAAGAAISDASDKAPDLPFLTGLVHQALLADLPDGVRYILGRLEIVLALDTDVLHLMEALSPLANVLRYGNVRRTDATLIEGVVDGIVVRICIGLSATCSSLDQEAASVVMRHLVETDAALALLNRPKHTRSWCDVLTSLTDQQGLHGLVSGRCCRLLMDRRVLSLQEASRRLGLACSRGTDPREAAAWVEGFLLGSGLLLLHSPGLWETLENWIMELPARTFLEVLPLLRRTFSTFKEAERRQMMDRVSNGEASAVQARHFSASQARAATPLLSQLLGWVDP